MTDERQSDKHRRASRWLLCICCLTVSVLQLVFQDPGMGAAGWLLLGLVLLEQ